MRKKRQKKMAEAKKCDRCNNLYEIPKEDGMPYNVTKDEREQDMCPECKYDLEDFMDNPVKKGKKRKKSEWSEEALEKQSKRMQRVQEVAKEIREQDDEDLTHQEAVKEASKLIKEGLNPGDKISKGVDGKTWKRVAKKYKCTMCAEHEVDGPHKMCEKCESDMDKMSGDTKKAGHDITRT